MSEGGCRNQGGKKKKKDPRPHLTSAASLFPRQTDREGQVEGETAWDKLEHWALSLSDFLGLKESVDGFACVFLFLCNGLF